jgi:hypothetical protein
MQDHLLQLMQLIQFCNVSSFSTVITNHFIGEDFLLSQHSMDGYEAMGFDVTQSTQDEEQSLFAIKTNRQTYGSIWGLFPLGKIWLSHSTIKSRFDKQ